MPQHALYKKKTLSGSAVFLFSGFYAAKTRNKNFTRTFVIINIVLFAYNIYLYYQHTRRHGKFWGGHLHIDVVDLRLPGVHRVSIQNIIAAANLRIGGMARATTR